MTSTIIMLCLGLSIRCLYNIGDKSKLLVRLFLIALKLRLDVSICFRSDAACDVVFALFEVDLQRPYLLAPTH